jgi:hypothetical protein
MQQQQQRQNDVDKGKTADTEMEAKLAGRAAADGAPFSK